MDIGRVYEHMQYCKRVAESINNKSQLEAALKLCTTFLRYEECENDVEDRSLFVDSVKYFFKGRLRERLTFLRFLHAVSDELQQVLNKKVDDLDSGALKDTKIGFYRTSK